MRWLSFSLILFYSSFGLCEPIIEPMGNSYSYPTETEKRIDANHLGRCLALATIEMFPDFYSSPNEMKKKKFVASLHYKADPYFPDFKHKNTFFTYIGAFPDRPFDYTSGKEDGLYSWVMNQTENSISPVALYKESLQLNLGNVWNAILTIHQLLRNMARWWDFDRYNFTPSNGHLTEVVFFNKFVDIRGDLREREGRFFGDHKGSWFRIWAAMLLRMMYKGNGYFRIEKGESSLKSDYILIDWINSQYVRFIAYMDGSFQKDSKKGKLNKVGVDTAISLFNGLHERNLPNQDCSLDSYLLVQ